MDNKKLIIVVAGFVVAFLLLVAAELKEAGQEWKQYSAEPVNLTLPTGKVERCLTCHQGIEEISPSHPIEAVGCVSCHGGNGLALDKDTAHTGLYGKRNPSELQYVQVTCGGENNECHTGRGTDYKSPADTVPLLLMATKAGEITEVGKTLGWFQDKMSRFAVQAVTESPEKLPPDLVEERGLGGQTPALKQFSADKTKANSIKFAGSCLSSCHLNTTQGDSSASRVNRPPEEQKYLGGCAACHVQYQPGSTYQGGDPTIDKAEPGHAPKHQLTTAIAYYQCNACHNQGVHSIAKMEFYPRDDVPPSAVTSPVADRYQVYYIAQERYAKCEVELDCIDCHTRNEVMGDGHLYGSKSKAQVIRCYNCHGTTQEPPKWSRITSVDDPAIWASGYFHKDFPELKVGDIVALTLRGEPMLNVRLENGRAVLYSKIDGRKLPIPLVQGSACQQKPDEQKGEDCHTCHSVAK